MGQYSLTLLNSLVKKKIRNNYDSILQHLRVTRSDLKIAFEAVPNSFAGDQGNFSFPRVIAVVDYPKNSEYLSIDSDRTGENVKIEALIPNAGLNDFAGVVFGNLQGKLQATSLEFSCAQCHGGRLEPFIGQGLIGDYIKDRGLLQTKNGKDFLNDDDGSYNKMLQTSPSESLKAILRDPRYIGSEWATVVRSIPRANGYTLNEDNDTPLPLRESAKKAANDQHKKLIVQTLGPNPLLKKVMEDAAAGNDDNLLQLASFEANCVTCHSLIKTRTSDIHKVSKILKFSADPAEIENTFWTYVVPNRTGSRNPVDFFSKVKPLEQDSVYVGHRQPVVYNEAFKFLPRFKHKELLESMTAKN